MEVPKDGWFIRENPIKMDDFRDTPISGHFDLVGVKHAMLIHDEKLQWQAVSKSDEYTSPHGANGIRTILLCLSCLGRVNYNDERRPDGDELASSCKKKGGFHSILGDREKIRGTYREIIVFDEDLIYPGYICRYTRVT